MNAVVIRRYGPPEVLELVNVPDPVAAAGQVVVRVVGSSVNPVDWHRMRGRPILIRFSEGLRHPKREAIGADISGVVEAAAPDVADLAPGDEVFGFGIGAFGERVAVAAEGVVRKPAAVDHRCAGVVGVAAITALQGLRDHGRIAPGQDVLVAGAGGGVGHFAVQIAKTFGARVTATTSAEKVDLVRSLGADEVVDYTRADGSAVVDRFDLIFDAGGWLSLRAARRALRPTGTAVHCGAGANVSIGSIAGGIIGAAVLTKLGSQRFVTFLAERKRADLRVLAEMLADGRIQPVIDRTYPLADIAAAVRYHEAGRATGKVAVTIAG